MRHSKQTYLIVLISLLFSSCNSDRQENNDRHKIESKTLNCLLDSIRKNDTLHINYTTMGCEHYFTEEIKVYKRSESLFAELTVSIPNRQKIPQPLTQLLTDSSIFAYSEFEKIGKTLKTADGCTTREEYVISLKADSIKFVDNGCEFDGYYLLKNKIFGQPKIDKYNEKIYR